MSAPALGRRSPPPAAAGISCMECETPIVGAIFMLHDQPYCCQRHRLVAYHKNEREGQRAPNGSAIASAPPSPAMPPAPGSPLMQPTGLRASFPTWM